MKELQGQFKTDFYQFVFDNYRYFINEKCGMSLQNFRLFPIEMQWGIVQAFSDYIDYFILVKKDLTGYAFQYISVVNDVEIDAFNTRPEAQQEAITQFEKWYNENK